MSRARTLKEIEERRTQYGKYIWSAVLLSMIAPIAGIAVYITLGLPSYFLADQVLNGMLISSFILSIISAIAGYLSKSGVFRGEYGSAVKLLIAAIALSVISIAFAASAFTPLADRVVENMCEASVVATSALPSCINSLKLSMYIAFGAYELMVIGAVVAYLLARRTLGLLLAYYAPRRARRG